MNIENMILQTPYLTLDEEFYNLTKSDPLEEPYLISFNPGAASLIELDEGSASDPLLVSLLNGTFIPTGASPFAMCYAGHQFGHYNPWLGDGRVNNLGTLNGWNLQTKGAGETLYSRSADGRAAIRSSIREYLMSESMFHLGIATTRALGIIGSKTKIIRNNIENAAIVISDSWKPMQVVKDSFNTLINKSITLLNTIIRFTITSLPFITLFILIIWFLYFTAKHIFGKDDNNKNK